MGKLETVGRSGTLTHCGRGCALMSHTLENEASTTYPLRLSQHRPHDPAILLQSAADSRRNPVRNSPTLERTQCPAAVGRGAMANFSGSGGDTELCPRPCGCQLHTSRANVCSQKPETGSGAGPWAERAASAGVFHL